MGFWTDQQVEQLQTLLGCHVARWHGMEMAILEGPPPAWSHPSVPMLQFCTLDFDCNEQAYRLQTAQVDDLWFLGINQSPHAPATIECAPNSIFREREVSELPIGSIDDVQIHLNDQNYVERLELTIKDHNITIQPGEIYEEARTDPRIVFLDESLLIQVDGKKPRLPF